VNITLPKQKSKRLIMKNLFSILVVLAAASLFIVACDSTTGPGTDISRVELQMKASAGNAVKGQVYSDKNQNTLEVQEVRFFIDELELESVQNDTLDFEIEDFIVNLPLDGTPLSLTEAEVPAGLYDEFELEMEKPDSDDAINDPDFRDGTGSYSVVAKGLYNGEAFMFRSGKDFEIEMDLQPSLEISEASNAVLVVSIDVESWFKNETGENLNPGDSSNTILINQNIERSFQGFDDDDDDSDDDDEEDEDDDDEDDEDNDDDDDDDDD
jgi:predicted small secreted protein